MNAFLQTEQEIAEVEAEIQGLEQSLADKVPPMMVAHTRLENRTQRPNVELCRDTPQYGMVEEVAEIADSQLQLQEKLDIARYIAQSTLIQGSIPLGFFLSSSL